MQGSGRSKPFGPALCVDNLTQSTDPFMAVTFVCMDKAARGVRAFLPHLVDVFHPSAGVTVRVQAGDPSEVLEGNPAVPQ